MTDLTQRVHQAFDEVVAPDTVKRETLAFISAYAEAEQAAHPMPFTTPSTPDASKRREGFRARSFKRTVAALAACLALVALGFGGFTLYAQPTAYVGIDVNPSIELGLNRFDTVVEVKALNDDGQTLLHDINLKGCRFEDALAKLTQSEAFAPYTQADAFIEISVTSDDARQAETLRSESDTCLQSLPCQGSCHAVDEQTREAAAQAGMGVGRYRAACELMELDPNITLEECSTMTMRELRDRIAAYSDEIDGDSSDASGGAGRGAHGNGHNAGHGHGSGKGAGRNASTTAP